MTFIGAEKDAKRRAQVVNKMPNFTVLMTKDDVVYESVALDKGARDTADALGQS